MKRSRGQLQLPQEASDSFKTQYARARDNTLHPQLGRFGFQRSDFLLEFLNFARLVVLPFRAGQFLTEKLQLLLDNFEAFFGFAVHRGCQ